MYYVYYKHLHHDIAHRYLLFMLYKFVSYLIIICYSSWYFLIFIGTLQEFLFIDNIIIHLENVDHNY